MSPVVDMGGGRERSHQSSAPAPDVRPGAGWVEAGERIARRRGDTAGLPLSALSELARAMTSAPGTPADAAERTLEAILRRAPDRLAAPAPTAGESRGEVADLCHAALVDELAVAGRESEHEVLAAGNKLARIYGDLSEHALALKTIHARFADGELAGAQTFGAVLASQATRLGNFPAAFDDVRDRVTHLRDLARKAGDSTSRILALATTVEKITTTINILGINALITAVHAGEHGAAFAVVANELRQLGSRTKEANDAIATLARELTKILPSLGEGGALITDLCLERSSELEATIGEITETLQSTYRGLQSSTVVAIEEAAARGASISGSCNEVLSHLMFQDRLQQHLTSGARIADIWNEGGQVDDDLRGRIQRLRVGTQRLAGSEAGGAPRPPTASSSSSPSLAGTASDSSVVDGEAGELNFL